MAAQPELWDDQARAQQILQELNDNKAQLEQLKTWQGSLDDTEAILELLEEDSDETLLAEAQSTLTDMTQALDTWELQQLLSGVYDKSGAVLTINAGAGGTDAQDWAEMLLRMYTRWAERQGYKVALVEQSDGEEAGLKSATLEIQGSYAFGYLKAEKGVEILAEEQGVLVKGNLDTLVLKDQLWVTIIESKQASFSTEEGLAQLLAYMLAAPLTDHPSYGLVTNGGSFLFVKLVRGDTPQYAVSDLFGIQNRRNGLYEVFQILKHLIQITASEG